VKRFLLFCWLDHYPAGGPGDVVDSFDTIEEARAVFNINGYENGSVLDLEHRQWVAL
jgi:hypothetical protein